MPENWKTYKLGDTIRVKHGYAFKGKHFTKEPNKYLLLTPGNFEPNGGIKFTWGKQKFYIGKFPKEYICSKDDLLIAMTDLTQSCIILGSPLVIKDDKFHYLHNQRLGLVQENEALIDKMFLYHYFNSYPFRQRLIATKSGSTVSHTAPERVYDCEIHLPPLPEQHAIASILSALDDKIENNLAMNKTLEAMAMALYKHWFVDFGPFQEGKFIDSELGLIPEGWEVLTYSDITNRITDGAHHSPKKVEEGYPMPSVKDMGDWGFDLKSCNKITKVDYMKLVQQGCKPLENDVVIAKDGSWLKHAFVVEEDLPVVLLSSIAILRPNGLLNSHLLNLNLKLDTTKQRMASIVTGAVIQRIVLKDFRKFEVIVPNQITQRKACEKIIPLIEKCWKNNRENSTLTQLRDTLLPKLISGEVRVKDIEKTVSELL